MSRSSTIGSRIAAATHKPAANNRRPTDAAAGSRRMIQQQGQMRDSAQRQDAGDQHQDPRRGHVVGPVVNLEQDARQEHV